MIEVVSLFPPLSENARLLLAYTDAHPHDEAALSALIDCLTEDGRGCEFIAAMAQTRLATLVFTRAVMHALGVPSHLLTGEQ